MKNSKEFPTFDDGGQTMKALDQLTQIGLDQNDRATLLAARDRITSVFRDDIAMNYLLEEMILRVREKSPTSTD